MTEAEVVELLRKRHAKTGNGGAGEYAFMAQVRNKAGFDATRTFDALAMALWPSRGLRLHAFEVKCSRSDWLREVKNPAKAEAACYLVDQFSIVASDPGIVGEGELPPTWGLLVVKGGRLVCVKDAPMLPHADPRRPGAIERSFVACMLRAGGAVPPVTAPEIAAARDAGYELGMTAGRSMGEATDESLRELRLRVREFEQAAGVSLSGWSGAGTPAEIGAALKVVLHGESHADRARRAMEQARDRLRSAADQLDEVLNAE